jgi:NAD(P)-dependent dehydrogenase (short-subunit alcohol dehydrogenase family)
MALLKGKTALITGGSAGVGLATAKRFVEEGAHVFINGRSQAELDAAVKEIGGSVTGVQGDGSKPGDRDRLYAAVTDAGRRLDIVFANAAAVDVARVGAVTQEHLQRALPLLNDAGSIILNSAGADAEGDDGTGAYAAILAALRSLGPAWAGELRDRQIRVNVISPDASETPDALAGTLNPGPDAAGEPGDYQRSTVQPARHATAEEVATAALFLASGQGSLTADADIPADGGTNQVAHHAEDLSGHASRIEAASSPTTSRSAPWAALHAPLAPARASMPAGVIPDSQRAARGGRPQQIRRYLNRRSGRCSRGTLEANSRPYQGYMSDGRLAPGWISRTGAYRLASLPNARPSLPGSMCVSRSGRFAVLHGRETVDRSSVMS